ncbi:hypothetical protein [Candidatus Enterovibrio escicola]|uniref:hypothetical protein n=1 Tax=Candidatus Enterovibrio escicola TaxID=1927127 RepID=UPI000BE36A74
MTLQNTFIISLLLIHSLFIGNSYATEHIYVYRYDERVPKEVFRNGFTALGNNDDIYEHMTGNSCKTGSLNLVIISTTTLYSYAEKLQELRVRQKLQAGEETTIIGYIYKTRADGNFYNMIPTENI